MILNAGDAKVEYKSESRTVIFDGSMRLANMKEYDDVAVFLKNVADLTDDSLELNFKGLQFLNNSGITTLSLFVLSCKKQGRPTLKVVGNKEISWQTKSLANFKKLWGEIELSM